MNKKALGEGMLGKIIIAIAVAIVLFTIVYQFQEKIVETSNVESCRLKVAAAAASKQLGSQSPLFHATCERDKLILEAEGDNGIVKDDKIIQNRAHRLIAEKMAECWYKLGEGKIDPFSAWDTKGESYCFICSTIEFDDDLKLFYEETKFDNSKALDRGLNGAIQSPVQYLTERTGTRTKGETYWKYMYGNDYTPIQETLEQLSRSAVFDGSTIAVSMYKIDEKNKWLYYGLSGGAILLSLATGYGAIVWAPKLGSMLAIPLVGTILAKVGISAAAIGIGAGFAAAGITAAAILTPIAAQAFADCHGCNALGGIALLPPGQEFDQKITVMVGDEEHEFPLCTRGVN